MWTIFVSLVCVTTEGSGLLDFGWTTGPMVYVSFYQQGNRGYFNFATLEIMRGNLENDSWLGLADVKESSFFFLLCQRKVIVTTYKGKCIADVLFFISPTKWRNNHILGIRNINICKMRKEQVHQPIQH